MVMLTAAKRLALPARTREFFALLELRWLKPLVRYSISSF